MTITDEVLAAQCLERIGYYRLSGYWYPFRQSRLVTSQNGKPLSQVLDDFRPGATFAQAMELYVFDKRLRMIFLDAIERIEVAIRVQVALLLSARDPWAHRSAQYLHGNFTTKVNAHTGNTLHVDWLKRIDELEALSKEEFVKHFRIKYSSRLPIWMAIELWDFGTLSKFVSGMKVFDQESVSQIYHVQRREIFTSWLRSINYVRNVCAHHSRLWNAILIDQPKPPRVGEIPLLDHLSTDHFVQSRLYGIAAPMQFLLRTINPSTSWRTRLRDHLHTFPHGNGVVLGQTGFPSGWENLPLWQ